MARLSKQALFEKYLDKATFSLIVIPVVLFGPILLIYILTYYRHILSKMKIFIAPTLTGFALTFLLTLIILFIQKKIKIVDRNTTVPLLGGTATTIAFIVSVCLFDGTFTPKTISILIGAFILYIVGTIDDIRLLSSRVRLIFQFIAAVIVMSSGLIITFTPKTWWGYALSYLLTLFWIIGIINSMNFFDGMDGLATGITMIASIFFFLITLYLGQYQIALLLCTLIGCCFAFLLFNFTPAKIYLGDGGSTVFGFLLACFAIYGGWSSKGPIIALSIPVCILGVLIFDMIYITLARILSGRVKTFKEWLDYRGEDHFHHRLVHLGFKKEIAVFFIYLTCALLGMEALALENAKEIFSILTALVKIILFFNIMSILMIIARKTNP